MFPPIQLLTLRQEMKGERSTKMGVTMTPKLSKERVINLARNHVNLPPLASSSQVQAEEMYELIKASMLEERPWPFCLEITSDLRPTESGQKLNYSYKYKLPTDAVGVVALSPNANYTVGDTLSRYDLIRIGIAPNDDQPPAASTNNLDGFHFKDGILHTNTKVDEVLYKREPAEKEFTTDFMLSLSWSLARYLAITVLGKSDIAAYCKQEADQYHSRAYKGLTRQFPNIDRKMLDSWVRQYYGRLWY